MFSFFCVLVMAISISKRSPNPLRRLGLRLSQGAPSDNWLKISGNQIHLCEEPVLSDDLAAAVQPGI
jgi:hypothetical protein